MKIIINLTILFSLLLSPMLMAQDIQGIATYKSQRKVDIKLDSTQFNDEMRQQMMVMLKKQFEREYTLEFTRDEAVYKQAPKLENETSMSGGGMQIVVAGAGDNDILYTNTTENRMANQNEMFGKIFLIKDALADHDWKMEKETKNIGEYTCFKATYEDTRTVRMLSTGDESENTEESNEEAFTVTAWYTPQIPVKHGPGEYNGLPGLILEVSDGTETILCSKVVINPNKGVDIEEPNTGKVVTEAEYREILDAKMEEMDEQFGGDGRRKKGHGMQIRIGG